MKIVQIIKEKKILKPNADEIAKQAEQEGISYFETQDLLYDTKKLEKPNYIVEMTSDELQLVSFYLELEKRKPIMNVKLDAKLGKEKK